MDAADSLTGKMEVYILARRYRPAENRRRRKAPVFENGQHFFIDAVADRLQNLFACDVSGGVDCDFDDHIASHTRGKFGGPHMRVRKIERQCGTRAPTY